MTVIDVAAVGLGRAHSPVTTILVGENQTATVHFHCPCGTNRRELLLDTHNHPPGRFAAAIRRLHEHGAWPAPATDAHNGAGAEWGPEPEETA